MTDAVDIAPAQQGWFLAGLLYESLQMVFRRVDLRALTDDELDHLLRILREYKTAEEALSK